MRVVALLSGGKDSLLNACHCVVNGHELVAIAHLYSEMGCELDSYMYQTVGNEAMDLLAECMNLPLYKKPICGTSLQTHLAYDQFHEGDEVEDLFQLLRQVQREKAIEAVASGAILSDYQRIRIEHVCRRLRLQHFAFLWRKDPWGILKDCKNIGLQAILVKTASIGLLPERHLGRNVNEIEDDLEELERLYGVHVCGEGGEYETWTLDCPLFEKSMSIESSSIFIHSADAFAPVAHLRINNVQLHVKDPEQRQQSLRQMYDYLREPIILGTSISLDRPQSLPHVESPILPTDRSLNEETTQMAHLVVNYPNPTSTPLPPISAYHRQLVAYGNYEFIEEVNNIGDHGIGEATHELLDRMKTKKKAIVFVQVFIKNFELMVEINQAYDDFFASESVPLPARVAMAWPLDHADILFRFLICRLDDLNSLRSHAEVLQHLRVTSRSYWAPIPIGAYSQAVRTNDNHLFISGQIGLIPSTMEMYEGATMLEECRLSLRHVQRIAEAMHYYSTDSLRAMTIYLTSSDHIVAVLECLQSIPINPQQSILSFVLLPDRAKLPRNARIEWEVVYRSSAGDDD
jgi:diphthine-ammonia ligase